MNDVYTGKEGVLDVAALVGSLRRESLTRKLVGALTRLAQPSMSIRIVEIGALPLHNQDDEFAPSAVVKDFRSRIASAQAVLFATPEYNRSIPACLKNAIDVGSRPYGQSVWAGKPAGIISLSPGSMGAFGANHALRQPLVFLNMPTMQQPEAYISGADKLFDAEANIASPSTHEFLLNYLSEFERWSRRQQRLPVPATI